MIKTDSGTYFARYSVEKAGEEEEYFTNIIQAEFFCVAGDEEVTIGKALYYAVDGDSAVAEGYSLPLVYDLYSETIAQYHSHLFDYDELKAEFKKTEGKHGYGVTSVSLFVVADMQIVANHRGRGLSLLFMEEAFSIFKGTAQLAVMHAYPVQHDKSVSHTDEWLHQMKFDELDNLGKTSSIGAVYYLGLALGFDALNEILLQGLCEEDLNEMYMIRQIEQG